MPLTPWNSDNEERTAKLSRLSGRKRSASEMEDETLRSKTTDTADGSDIGADGAPDANSSKGTDTPETVETVVKDDCTEYTVECPLRPKRGKAGAKDDVYASRDAPSLAPHLSIDFGVRPGRKWEATPVYKNAKFKDPDVLYTVGDVVYINRHSPIPPPPPADASEDEKLQYDRENCWVGLIAEFRATNPANVYARVFWFYWPEELTMGRQHYHGKHELILSNYTDIIDAHSIACHAEVSHWDEYDDSNQTVMLERYWRQTYDVTKLGSNPAKAYNALSKLRKYCICQKYDNPNVDMYQCRDVDCRMWNHEACLIKDIEARAWEQFQRGSLTHEIQVKPHEKGFTQKMGETLGHIVNLGLGRVEVKKEDPEDPIPIAQGNKKLKATTGRRPPWSGKLEGKIVKVNVNTHAAIVTQLVPNPDSKPEGKFEPKVWHMKMSCLRCREELN